MLIFANVQNALEQLWTHRLRSLLTVLGIVIAVTSTITVVGVIQGFTSYVSEFLQGLGTNAMWVWPERPAGEAGKRLGRAELDERDMEAVEGGCSPLVRVSPLVRRTSATLHHGREELAVPLERVSAEYHAIRTEAVALSVAGGGFGIALGYALCALATLPPQMVDVVVPGWAVALGFGISAGTGVVFGLVPAVKAALLNPIDALRHE